MYQAPFVAAREVDFFRKKENVSNITAAVESDLTRFIPQNIYSLHREGNFGEFINTLKEVTSVISVSSIMTIFIWPPLKKRY